MHDSRLLSCTLLELRGLVFHKISTCTTVVWCLVHCWRYMDWCFLQQSGVSSFWPSLCTVSIGTAVRQLYPVFFLFIICAALHSGGIFKNLLHASWPRTAVLVYSSVTAVEQAFPVLYPAEICVASHEPWSHEAGMLHLSWVVMCLLSCFWCLWLLILYFYRFW